MNYKVYAIRSVIRNYIYVGHTNNIERRLREHNSGKTKSIRPFIPFKLIYIEDCEDRMEAIKREKYLKSGIGKEFLKSIKE